MAIQSVHYQGKGYVVTRRMKVGSGGLDARNVVMLATTDSTGNTVIKATATAADVDAYAGIYMGDTPASEGDWVDVAVPVRGVVVKARCSALLVVGDPVETEADGEVGPDGGTGLAIGIALETGDGANSFANIMLTG